MKGERILHYSLFLAVFLLMIIGPMRAWGQETTENQASEQAAAERAKAEERAKTEEKVPTIPEREKPGYFPGLIFPTYYGIAQQVPVTGVMAPYGNGFAFDSLRRGWITHGAGPVMLTPYLEYGGLYRSNIFSSPTNKQSDYVNVLSPGLYAELPIAGQHRVSVGYLGNYWIYSTHGEQDHFDNYANVDAQLNFTSGLSVRFGNAFTTATEEADTQLGRNRPYLRNTPYVLAAYNMADKWKIQAIYTYDLWQYDKSIDKFNDYREQALGAYLYYKFLPKTSAFVGYGFSSRVYPSFQADNNIKQTPFVGLTWDPTSKLTGQIKFGYTFQNYVNDVTGRNDSPNSWAASIGTIYRFSRYTNLNVSLQRSIQENLSFNNQPYKNTGVWVSLNHDWARFQTASYLSFSYANASYINNFPDPGTGELKTRNDNTITLGAGVSRPITRWARVRLDYSYINNASNFFIYEYNEHRAMFGVQLSF
jgi:hypothetical protein